MTITVQISRNGRSSPSPSGRRWREAPDEGLRSRGFTPLTRRFAPPSPGGRGTPPKQVGIRVAVPEPALALDIRRSRLRNLDSNGHRPPLQLSRYVFCWLKIRRRSLSHRVPPNNFSTFFAFQ